MQMHILSEITGAIPVPHYNCPDASSAGIQGGYDLLLDSYQLNDLETNGYTIAEDHCLLCLEPGLFLLKIPLDYGAGI
jgi:hypothetical protein